MILYLKNGNKIHIKKKNKGLFTKYCHGKVTNECIRRAKASGNPTLIKRATFAQNSRKWKHQKGGILVTPEMEQNRYQGEITPGKGFTDKLKDVGKALGQFIPFIGTALDTEERQGYAAAVGSMKDIGIPAFTYTANNKQSNRTYRGWDRKRHRNKNYGKPYINSRLAKPLAKGLGIVGLILDTPNMVSDLENLKRALGFNYNHQLLMKEQKGGKLCLIPRN